MTTATRKSTTTPSAFRRTAERIMREAHSDTSIAFEWTRCQRVTWHDGTKGFSGTVTVKAPGYRTRDMIATAHDTGISVR